MAERRRYVPTQQQHEQHVEYFNSVERARTEGMPLEELDNSLAVLATKSKETTGRESKYEPVYDEIVTSLLMLGSHVVSICAILEITPQTFRNWCKEHPSFFAAVLAGREVADAKVAKSLFHRATGYSHPEEKISVSKDGDVTRVATVKHYPPDTAAGVYWLNNRRRRTGDWKSSVDVTTPDSDGNVVDPTKPPRITIKTTPSTSKE